MCQQKKKYRRLNHGASLLGWLHISSLQAFPTEHTFRWRPSNVIQIIYILFCLFLFYCVDALPVLVRGPYSTLFGGMIMEEKPDSHCCWDKHGGKSRSNSTHKRKYDFYLHRWITHAFNFTLATVFILLKPSLQDSLLC